VEGHGFGGETSIGGGMAEMGGGEVVAGGQMNAGEGGARRQAVGRREGGRW
jgi:hypothetical protein